MIINHRDKKQNSISRNSDWDLSSLFIRKCRKESERWHLFKQQDEHFLHTFTAVSWLLAKQTSLVHAVLQIFTVFYSLKLLQEKRGLFLINYNHLNSMKHNVACYMFSARWLRMQCFHLVRSQSTFTKFKRESSVEHFCFSHCLK